MTFQPSQREQVKQIQNWISNLQPHYKDCFMEQDMKNWLVHVTQNMKAKFVCLLQVQEICRSTKKLSFDK